ncbi:MAG: hypothetical protein ACFFAE_02400, partial [Candidatus Hodarchaeota archaeon]
MGFWLFVGNYFSVIFEEWSFYQLTNLALFLSITASFCLDTIIIGSYSLIFAVLSYQFLNKSNIFYLTMSISLLGIIWILISFYWRIPLYIFPGLRLPGFGFYSTFIYSILNPDYDSSPHIFLFVNGLVLFLFLF